MTTEGVFDTTSRSPETLDIFQALKDSEPTVDHSARWREAFQPALERIASRATRQSQAQECRKIFLEALERLALAQKLISLPNADCRDELIHSFFPQLTDQGTPKLLSHLVRVYFYGMVDVSAVFLLYTLQFNSTVHIEKFDKFYRAMCDVQAEFMVHKAMFSREEWSDATTNAYQEYILSPLEDQFASIKREFKENLYLLSPMPPDGSRVLEFVNDKYPKQFDAFKQAAANNVDAAYKACDSGDYVAALKILRPLADQSNAQARYLLGYLYDQGRGVAQNDVEAVKWYRLAADQGEAGAQYNLGNMYLQGRGVVQDDVEAVRWLCLAADHGSAEAQYNLGAMYEMGRGVTQNYVDAYRYYSLSAAGLNGEEQNQAIENRDKLSAKMTAQQVAEGQRLAQDWKPKKYRLINNRPEVESAVAVGSPF